jgi:hypothetical protein
MCHTLEYCGYGLLVTYYYTGGDHLEWWAVGIVQSTALTWNWKNRMTSKYMIVTYRYHEVWNKCQGLGITLKAQETLVELANWWMTINCFSLGCRIEDLAWLEKCFNQLPQKVRLPLGREFRCLPHAWTSIIKFTHPSIFTSLRIVSYWSTQTRLSPNF